MSRRKTSHSRHKGRRRTLFLPALLLATAFLSQTVLQVIQLGRENSQLRAKYDSQEQAMEDSRKVRAQLDVIARETKKLALAGNGNAQLIVARLERQGVSINPSADSASSQATR